MGYPIGRDRKQPEVRVQLCVSPGNNTEQTTSEFVDVTNCHSATFKKNHVIQDVPNAAAGHTAMYYQNTNFTYIECNDFLNTDAGLVVAGTQNSPTEKPHESI